MPYKYQLEKNSPKGTCPECHTPNKFRYYDGFDHSLNFGICDRKNHCGCHNKPDGVSVKKNDEKIIVQAIEQLFFDQEQAAEFIANQTSPFHTWAFALGITPEHLTRWGVGSDTKGNTKFVMCGSDNKTWNIKTIKYLPNGKRSKDKDAFSLKQPDPAPDAPTRQSYLMPLYGSNLLSPISKNKKVCLVESEKSAVVASFFYPEYDWVACGSNVGLTDDKAELLKGRTVWNLRDADLAGRSTCSAKKMETCATPFKCEKCRVPHIEKQLAKHFITHYYLDLFPDRADGYDIADAISDGLHPNLHEFVTESDYVQKKAEKEREINEFIEDENARIEFGLPDGVSAREYIKYGFYEFMNRYYMRTDKGNIPVSNFTIEPLFFIPGDEGKRIVRLKNEHGKQIVVDFDFKELNSLSEFTFRLEKLGHFIYEGTAKQLYRIKNKIYAAQSECVQISTPGLFQDDMWVWANGIYKNGTFYPINEYGMVEIPKEIDPTSEATDDQPKPESSSDWYYLPFMSRPQYVTQRYFQHIPSDITFESWSKQFHKVYGEKAMIAIAFLFVAVYRDIIFERTRCTPLLFLSGQKSSGKGTIIDSLLYLFGTPAPQFMLGGSRTVTALTMLFSQMRNGIVWLDEYKNGIPPNRIEAMKNLWDGIGTLQGAKTNDNSTKQTEILEAAIISGQEIPIAEPALLSRLILLTFMPNPVFSEAQTLQYELLVELQKKGLTDITNYLCNYRQIIKDNFGKAYRDYIVLLKSMIKNKSTIEHRQYQNYAILYALCHVLNEHITLPFKLNELNDLIYDLIQRQNKLSSSANDEQKFWEGVSYLMQTHKIHIDRDYAIKQDCIAIRFSIIYAEYRQQKQKEGYSPIDGTTLTAYLKDSDAFDRKSVQASGYQQHRFANMDMKAPTTCLIFNLNKIEQLYGINLLHYAPISTSIDSNTADFDKETPDFDKTPPNSPQIAFLNKEEPVY